MAVDQNSDVGTIDVCLVKNNSSSTEFEPLDNGEKQFTASLTDLVSGLDRASDPEDMPLLAGKWLAEATGSDHIGVAVLSATDEPLSFTLQRVDAFETESRQPVELSADAAESLSGLTLASGTLTAVEHLARDERVVDQVLEAAGIASAIVCPIVIQGKTTGTFGVYHSAPLQIEQANLLLAEAASHMLGAAMARAQAESALSVQTGLLMSMMDSQTPVAVLTDDGRVQRVNAALAELACIDSSDVKSHPFTHAFVTSKDEDLVWEAICRAKSHRESVTVEAALKTGGEVIKHIRWSFSAVCDSKGDVCQVTACGVDVTRQTELTTELHLSQVMLSEIRQELEQRRSESVDDSSKPGSQGEVESSGPGGVELRKYERRPFPYYQRIAPIRDGKLPELTDFTEVRMKDISVQGFAFLVPRPPKIDRFVVELGPSQIYLFADVKHVTSCTVDGRRMFTVGCQYSGRATYLAKKK